MSLFSYIAFPRKVDTSCLKSMVDRSKELKVKDTKGTQWESWYSSLPEDIAVYVGDPRDFWELQVWEKDSREMFIGVFENNNIYAMNARLGIYPPNLDAVIKKSRYSKEELLYYASLGKREVSGNSKKDNQYLIRDKVKRMLEESFLWYPLRCTKQLYDLTKLNTNPGEIVEVYSEWIDGRSSFTFGPPREIVKLGIEDMFTSGLLSLEDGLKIEIYS